MENLVMTDIQLIENIRQGDYVSYNNLFIRYYNRLCLYVSHITNKNDDSEDVVQELFIKLWTNHKKIDIQSTVSGYLFQMARNMALNHVRCETNRKKAIGRIPIEPEQEEIDGLEYEEFSTALNDCLRQLPERSREVLLMHRMYGLKQKEISEKLNITVQTIKNQIWASMQRLKLCLENKSL